MLQNDESDELAVLIKRCLEARREYERNEIVYYEFLFGVMQEYASTWGVYKTFETFIEKCIGRPNPAKWTRYLQAREALGVEKLEEIGLWSAFEAMTIRERSKRDLYVAETRAWSEQHGGVHASEEQARRTRRDIEPIVRTPALGRVEELEQLRAENRELRAKLGAAERENARLRERVAKFAGVESAKQGGARKAGSKRSESRPS